jgi:hypothetical protein
MRIITETPKITIVLLNFKRPQNIPLILEAIARQTVKATVFLWNNGDADVDSPQIDRYHQSESNVGCMARWKLAKEATTPYVMSLDDDICFHRVDALETVIKSLERQDDPNRIVGFLGACFNLVPNYAIRREFMCTYRDTIGNPCGTKNTHRISFRGKDMYVIRRFVAQDEGVDVVKGRVMAFRTQLLDEISLPEEREDDIFLSATLANKARKFHRIPTLLNDAFYELPEHGEGSWHEPGHFTSRDRALKTYFSPNVIYGNWLSDNAIWSVYLFKILLKKLYNRFS